MSLGISKPKKINASSKMPLIGSESISSWSDKLYFIKEVQTIVDYEEVLTEEKNETLATIQPLQLRQIELKPEGQRAWNWFQIHALVTDYGVTVNDIVEINEDRYKVMGIYDYKRNGFIELHCVSDYE